MMILWFLVDLDDLKRYLVMGTGFAKAQWTTIDAVTAFTGSIIRQQHDAWGWGFKRLKPRGLPPNRLVAFSLLS
jgi:hypothetical protein